MSGFDLEQVTCFFEDSAASPGELQLYCLWTLPGRGQRRGKLYSIPPELRDSLAGPQMGRGENRAGIPGHCPLRPTDHSDNDGGH